MNVRQLSKLIGIACLMFTSQVAGQDKNDYNDHRKKMIENQIVSRGVTDENVISVMSEIPRHLFIEESQWPIAYSDGPLPIGHGQTISQPYIVAFMTELLQPDTHHVLEIGTGSGYQAAVLAKLVHHVFTIEIVSELGRSARKTLKRLGYENVSVRVGDGYKGWPKEAPFDRIIVTAAPEKVPQALVDQLKPGGRMVLPVGPRWWGQDLLVIEKDLTGEVIEKKTLPVRFRLRPLF